MPRHNHIRAHKQQPAARDLGDFVDDVKDVLGLRDDDEATTRKQRTSTAIVYVTLKPTFTGEIGGYKTVIEEETPVVKTTKKPTPTPQAEEKEPTQAPTKPKTTLAQVTTKPVAKPSAVEDEETSLLSSIKVSKSTGSTTEPTDDASLDEEIATTKAAGKPLSQASSSASSTSAAEITDGGMSGGAKAGVAIGVILGLGLIAGLIFFVIRKKKSKENADNEKVDNEKVDNFGPGFVGAGAAVAGSRSEKPAANAPRLDVRPTTAFFMPNRASQMAKSSSGTGNLMSAQNSSPAKPGWERPSNQDQNAANPFGDNAATIDPVNAREPNQMNGARMAIAAGAAGAAVGAAAANRSNSQVNGQNGAVSAVVKGPVRSTSRGGAANRSPIQGQGPFSDAARTDGGAQGTAQLVQSSSGPMPLSGVIEEGGPLSPKSAGFPGSPAAPVIVGAATGAAIGAAAGNELPLYRVHLDFSPSMPDELRVRAGEIVRLLKEFDDGWCMCTSDDLKREGVLPRTCISNRPIRRPQNGPNNGSPGPIGPNGQRRMSPPQNRGPPPINNNGRGSPAPGQGPQYRPQQRAPGPNGRPMGPPGQGRPMSPGMGPNGRNSPGPGHHGPGPQYRPQQNSRPMSPAMGPNGGPRPQQRGPGPNSPMSSPAQQQGQFAQQPRSQTPQGRTPPRALQAGLPSQESVAHIAANFPLPGSPTTSEAPRSPKPEQVEFKTAVPEVIVTGSASPVQVGGQSPQVERKPVGRKPLPGQAQ